MLSFNRNDLVLSAFVLFFVGVTLYLAVQLRQAQNELDHATTLRARCGAVTMEVRYEDRTQAVRAVTMEVRYEDRTQAVRAVDRACNGDWTVLPL